VYFSFKKQSPLSKFKMQRPYTIQHRKEPSSDKATRHWLKQFQGKLERPDLDV
jgi:hypothetical protein